MGIRVVDVAFVQFQAPDLDEMEAFLVEFGMVTAHRTATALYMRGTDGEPFVHMTHLADEPGFVGLTFLAASVEDLGELASSPGSAFGPVEDFDGPGGGRVVRATDPSGNTVEVIAGRATHERLPLHRNLEHNDAAGAPRAGAPLRVRPGPSQVKRLGHVVLDVLDFGESEAWYKKHLGLVTSDEVKVNDDVTVGAFLRCDVGERFVDHHTLFLIGARRHGFNHAAFEVRSFDDLMAGNAHLDAAGREQFWGVGRHILGSQIYDYWKDPWGHVVEHWTDGDLFNNETPPNVAPLHELIDSQWGPTTTAPTFG